MCLKKQTNNTTIKNFLSCSQTFPSISKKQTSTFFVKTVGSVRVQYIVVLTISLKALLSFVLLLKISSLNFLENILPTYFR